MKNTLEMFLLKRKFDDLITNLKDNVVRVRFSVYMLGFEIQN